MFLSCGQMVEAEILEMHPFTLEFQFRILLYYLVYCDLQSDDYSVCSEICFACPGIFKI